MSKYGDVAINAAKMARNGVPPIDAWQKSSLIVFPTQKASREKGCPKCAFLGLAEEGLIKGVPKGNYTKSKDNKLYAMKAVIEIHNNPNLTNDKQKLWKSVSEGSKQHNGQLDVVIALGHNKDI